MKPQLVIEDTGRPCLWTATYLVGPTATHSWKHSADMSCYSSTATSFSCCFFSQWSFHSWIQLVGIPTFVMPCLHDAVWPTFIITVYVCSRMLKDIAYYGLCLLTLNELLLLPGQCLFFSKVASNCQSLPQPLEISLLPINTMNGHMGSCEH